MMGFSFIARLLGKKEPDLWEIWYQEQLELLFAGKEIEPPWIAFPKTDGWWGGWRQGNPEGWRDSVWLPFWLQLSHQERLTYAEKWEATPEWREYLFDYWVGEESN